MKQKGLVLLLTTAAFLTPVLLFSGTWNLIGLNGLNVRAIAAHPLQPDTILAADNTSIYRTTDGGTNWQMVAAIPARELLFHSSFPDTVFAVWGNGSYSDGIWRSVNAGGSFDILNFFYWATCISVPTWPPGHILAGLDSSGGAWRSTDEGLSWFEYSDSLQDMNVLSLSYSAPCESIYQPLAGTSTGIYYGTADYWVKANAPNLPCVAISSEFNIVDGPIFAALGDGSWSDGVYKSVDCGVSWNISWYWIYITSVLVNPLNEQVVFAADSGYGVIMTTDGGENWVEINENLGDYNINNLAMSRSDTVHLYAATCSGVYRYDPDVAVAEWKKNRTTLLTVNMPTIGIAGTRMPIRCTVSHSQQKDKITLTLRDITGRKLCFKQYNVNYPETHLQLDLPQTNGIYYVEINIAKQTARKKIIIMRGKK